MSDGSYERYDHTTEWESALRSSGRWPEGDSDKFHGCSIRIHAEDTIHHYVRGECSGTRPNVRSYRDGIKVGCTFVTTEALNKLYKLHKEFLSNPTSKDHQ